MDSRVRSGSLLVFAHTHTFWTGGKSLLHLTTISKNHNHEVMPQAQCGKKTSPHLTLMHAVSMKIFPEPFIVA